MTGGRQLLPGAVTSPSSPAPVTVLVPPWHHPAPVSLVLDLGSFGTVSSDVLSPQPASAPSSLGFGRAACPALPISIALSGLAVLRTLCSLPPSTRLPSPLPSSAPAQCHLLQGGSPDPSDPEPVRALSALDLFPSRGPRCEGRRRPRPQGCTAKDLWMRLWCQSSRWPEASGRAATPPACSGSSAESSRDGLSREGLSGRPAPGFA